MCKAIVFVCGEEELVGVLEGAKQRVCPWCGQRGWLNVHDHLRGVGADGEVVRGRRLWCAKRNRRRGCGHTIRMVFADVLPRHLFNATVLWLLLKGLIAGLGVPAAWEGTGCRWLLLSAAYKLLGRLRGRLPELRTALSGCCRPPGSVHADPLLQTIQHLDSAFEAQSCPISAFQRHLGMPLMG